MDNSTQGYIAAFLAQYDTLAIATEDDGQPYVTRVFYAEGPIEEHKLRLYGTFITSSRKLANLQNNPRVGLFIGPQEPTMWLEGTATARVLTDEKETQKIRDVLGQKSSVAAGFIARVPIAAVELKVQWLRITDVAATPMITEVTFDAATGKEQERR
ncbi:MAG TPA: pyridoxamine 5'-phosphate oxidase family protein [Ktedonobacteraceae bacterium]|nr:pyridoxamine 5'-phosphate oxidase family protein [Ktedonobacteraceae bacterium]